MAEAHFNEAVQRMAGLARKGMLVEAARAWMTAWANEEEMTALMESGYLEACAKYVPVLLRMLEHTGESDDPGPTDRSVLQQITAPVLILQGSRSEATWDWFGRSTRHVADHVADAHVREIARAGHMGALVEPEAISEELIPFFAERLSAA